MVCPFIDSDHAHCAENLKLDKLDYAVAVCGNDFTVCPVFWDQMTRVRNERDAVHKSVA